MSRRRSAALVAALGMVGTLIAVMPARAEQSAAAELKWAACPADVNAKTAPLTAQCATVPVPLDYSEPDGAQISLLVSRIASTKPEQRRGILMFNPGGPGGSGLDQPAFLARRACRRACWTPTT